MMFNVFVFLVEGKDDKLAEVLATITNDSYQATPQKVASELIALEEQDSVLSQVNIHVPKSQHLESPFGNLLLNEFHTKGGRDNMKNRRSEQWNMPNWSGRKSLRNVIDRRKYWPLS